MNMLCRQRITFIVNALFWANFTENVLK